MVDVQGCFTEGANKYTLTDPAFHTDYESGLGETNLGKKVFFSSFFFFSFFSFCSLPKSG